MLLNLLLFNFCNNCSFVEVSNKEIIDFLASNYFLNFFVFFKFLLMGFHEKRESISGFHDNKKVEEHWSRELCRPWVVCMMGDEHISKKVVLRYSSEALE